MDLVLRTERLLLRAFRQEDAERFQSLAGDWDVSRMTSDIPHPLSLEQARQWLMPAPGEVRLAITENGVLAGGVGYFRRPSGAAEIGFWLGRDYWGRGIATEAVGALITHGFGIGGETAMTSSHFIDNPASARVLVKCGFQPAGRGQIWSLARGAEVAAEYVWLTRERAVEIFDIPPPAARKRWASLLGRRARRASFADR